MQNKINTYTQFMYAKNSIILFLAYFCGIIGVLFFMNSNHTFASYAIGTEAEEAQAKEIQQQLTNSYLASTKKAEGVRVLEKKILETKIDTLTAEDNIAAYNQDISVLQKEINVLFQQLSKPKQRIAALETEKREIRKQFSKNGQILLQIYIHLEKLQNTKKSSSENLLSSLFADNSIENIEQEEVNNLLKLEKKIKPAFSKNIRELYQNTKKQNAINQEISPLQTQYKKISERRDALEQKKEREEELLLQAQSSKDEYSKLLTITRKQMMESMLDSVRVDAEIEILNDKLTELETNKVEKQQQEARANAEKIEHIKASALEKENAEKNISTIDVQLLQETENIPPLEEPLLSWPINPTKGISAGFREASYYNRFKMQHNAIDIPAPQGTPIHSSAAGYVYKAKDNGLGYSYIIILHKNNIRTVYGHVSKIQVTEGQLVQEGEQIGLSGGQPGTAGAGKMTTGPHLHFEVLENGVYKNPIEFLEKGVL